MRGTVPPCRVFLPLIGVVLFFFAAMYSFARQQPSHGPMGSGKRENLSYSKPTSPQAATPQGKAKTPPPKGPDGDYVGSETCITCHESLRRVG